MAFFDLAECVAAWMFDGESAGDDADDKSTFGANDLSDTGAVTVARSAGGGKFGGDAADFTGGDARLTRPVPLTFVDLKFDEWTLSCWAKHSGAWPEISSPYLVCRQSSVSQGSYRLFHDGSAKRLTFLVSSTGSDSFTIAGDSIPAGDAWISIVVTHDGTSLRMYIDNVEVSTGAVAFGSTPFANNEDFSIGATNDGAASSRLDGYLDEVAMFNRVLTDLERLQLFTSGLQGGFSALGTSKVDNTSPLAVGYGNVATFSVVDTTTTTTEPDLDNVDPLNAVADNKDPLEGVPSGGS